MQSPASIDKTFNPNVTIELLEPDFPLIQHWKIHVSVGMTGVLHDLLMQIYGILGSTPALRFFRIVEESLDGEPYQHQITTFLNPYTRDGVKIRALNHAISRANDLSKKRCYKCGMTLVKKDVKDEDNLRLYPYLAHIDTDGYRQTPWVCLSCCESEWEQAKADTTNSIDDPEQANSNDSNGPKADEVHSGIQLDHTVIAIYQKDEIDKIEHNYQDGTRDQINRVKGIIKKIKRGSPDKQLVKIPADWSSYCDDLAQQFPNFVDVIEFIRTQFALSALSDCIVRTAPILVVGGAGVGKSEFMFTFAEMLKTRIEVINVSNVQTGSCLTGSEAYWSNSQPGRLFEMLVNGEIGNPLIMLDEIDKARDDDSYKPLAALHQLLEPRQARHFFDLSIPELHFNASYVCWMATANTLETIGQPIIDRFTVFHIDAPSQAQMIEIIKNQYSKFINDHPSGGYFESQPRSEVLEAMSSHHPRKVRKILDQCFGLAALEKRNYLTVCDVHACDIVKKDTLANTGTGIGFLAPI